MTNSRKIFFKYFVLLSLLVHVFNNGAVAGSLSDPTLPSASWSATQADALIITSVSTMYSSPDMQMVLISQSRTFVLIDGRFFKIGDYFNGSTILSIGFNKVVMRDASKSLNLTPAVEKIVITPASQRKNRRVSPKPKVIVNKDGS